MSKRDVSTEIYNEEKLRNSKAKKYNPLVYDFLPKDDGQSKDNRLYLGLYDISKIPELSSLKKPKDSWVFTYGVYSHYVWDNVGHQGHNIICQNPSKNIFINPKSRCHLCAIADKIYEVRKKWQGTKSFESVKDNSIYKQISEKGRKFIAVKKLPYVCLDIDKILKKKPLSESEQKDGLGMQVVGMPNNVDKQIRQFYDNGYKFFDIIEEGKIYKVYVVNITRDNASGAKNAKYSCVIEKEPIVLDPTWIDCLDDVPNPIEILFKSIDTEEEIFWFKDLCERIAPSQEEINNLVNLKKVEDSSVGSAPIQNSVSSGETVSSGEPISRRRIVHEDPAPQEETSSDGENDGSVSINEAKQESNNPPTSSQPEGGVRKRKRILFDAEK